jgi:hypothetical protein
VIVGYVAALVAEITYKEGWVLQLLHDTDGRNLSLQWHFPAPCAKTGVVQQQYTRVHRLSPAATDGEIVQTAFAAALQAEEHECREFFKFAGRRIFDPHLSLQALYARADDEAVAA